MSPAEFEGLTAVVTGGASGIGLATAELLCARGARVAVFDIGRPPDDPALSAVLHVRADVTDQSSVDDAVRQAVNAFGGLDVVINNAGIGAVGSVEQNSDDEWRAVFDVNVFGIVRMMRACLPHLRRSRAASVVNTCSIAATAGLPQRALYSATKGAVQSLTLAMAADHVHEKIRINCVNPGTADTPWIDRLLAFAADPQEERRALEARQPMGRLVSPQEVAAAIVYLASPYAASTTATVLDVDGGMHGLRLPKASKAT